MMTIDVETLRVWLEERRPVTILDVRPTAEWAEWAIPGSIHVNAYDALRAHDRRPTAGRPDREDHRVRGGQRCVQRLALQHVTGDHGEVVVHAGDPVRVRARGVLHNSASW